jgi:hyperosmotically inducible periplasmic protein
MRCARDVAGVAVLAVTCGVAACNRSGPETTTTGQAPQQAPATRSDDSLTTSVQARYYADDRVRGRDIDVSTNNGVVTLKGTVDDQATKEQAVSVARSVEGVRRVDDQLQVASEAAAATIADRSQPEPSPRGTGATGTAGTDPASRVEPGWITTKIQAQYFVNPEIKPWNIDVTTTSAGVVTLKGEVENAADKAEAVRIARETEGVTQVDDRLRVEGQPETSGEGGVPATADAESGPAGADAWVTSKIQARYFLDSEVKGRDVDVTTEGGIVTLRGTVGSEAERRHAIALARNTDGVRSVTDQLQVRADAATGDKSTTPLPEVKSVRQPITDPWITTKIQSKFFLDPAIKGHEIDVDTKNGLVTLKGTVGTEEQKQEAERIARETEGVTRVTNQITIEQR